MYFQLFNEGNGSSDSCPVLNRVLELIYSKFYRLRVNRRWKFGGQVQAVPTELRFEFDKERISIVGAWGTQCSSSVSGHPIWARCVRSRHGGAKHLIRAPISADSTKKIDAERSEGEPLE